ncbi:MAG: hypothetical protein MJ252_14430, partial [archaeon]|nr:hypothetical protein [archaeon]
MNTNEGNQEDKIENINIIDKEDSEEDSENIIVQTPEEELEKNISFTEECKGKQNPGSGSTNLFNTSFESNNSFHSYNSAKLPNSKYEIPQNTDDYNNIFSPKDSENNIKNIGNNGLSSFSPLLKIKPKSRFSATAFGKHLDNPYDNNKNINLSPNSSFCNNQNKQHSFSCFRQVVTQNQIPIHVINNNPTNINNTQNNIYIQNIPNQMINNSVPMMNNQQVMYQRNIQNICQPSIQNIPMMNNIPMIQNNIPNQMNYQMNNQNNFQMQIINQPQNQMMINNSNQNISGINQPVNNFNYSMSPKLSKFAGR